MRRLRNAPLAVGVACNESVLLRVAHILHERYGTNAAFDHDIGRTTDHDEMLDIVTSHKNKTSARINGGRIQHL